MVKNAFRSGGEERNVTGFIDPSCDTEIELFISGTWRRVEGDEVVKWICSAFGSRSVFDRPVRDFD